MSTDLMTSEFVSHEATNVLPVLAERYSTRMFDRNRPIPEPIFASIIEAARWAPSAGNAQPWKLIIAAQGSNVHDTLISHLADFNNEWVPDAPMLIATVVEPANDSTQALLVAHHDLGQAMAHASVQAQSHDVYTHQLTGFNAPALNAELGIQAPAQIFSMMALGYRSQRPEDFIAEIQRRESLPRARRSHSELLYKN